MSNEANAKRRGRPAGSNSFVKIKMTDLIRLVGEGGVVPISKVWLREMGVAVAEVAPIQIVAAAEPVAEEEKISFSLTTFDDENDEE
jgi:hypothetical protein